MMCVDFSSSRFSSASIRKMSEIQNETRSKVKYNHFIRLHSNSNFLDYLKTLIIFEKAKQNHIYKWRTETKRWEWQRRYPFEPIVERTRIKMRNQKVAINLKNRAQSSINELHCFRKRFVKARRDKSSANWFFVVFLESFLLQPWLTHQRQCCSSLPEKRLHFHPSSVWQRLPNWGCKHWLEPLDLQVVEMECMPVEVERIHRLARPKKE